MGLHMYIHCMCTHILSGKHWRKVTEAMKYGYSHAFLLELYFANLSRSRVVRTTAKNLNVILVKSLSVNPVMVPSNTGHQLQTYIGIQVHFGLRRSMCWACSVVLSEHPIRKEKEQDVNIKTLSEHKHPRHLLLA